MLDEASWAFNGNHYNYLFVICLLLGLVLLKGKRKILLIPAVLITASIVNPLTYNIWYRFNTRAYWRLIWTIPVIVVCAVIPSFVVEKARKTWIKLGTIVIGVVVFAICGSMIYAYEGSSFKEAYNSDKLPKDAVEVAEALLEIDDEPYVVADYMLSVYLRQYSGKIRSIYGRDVAWGVADTDIGRKANENLYGDITSLAQIMLDYDYEYLVTTDKGDRENELTEAGFKKIRRLTNYGIYRINGSRTEIRTYDDLHRVKSITTVDEAENPVDINGYATVEYAYDSRGHIVDECYYDENGNRSYYDVDDKPANLFEGYASVEYSYSLWGKLIFDHYYDINGEDAEQGKYYLHQYLNDLTGKDCVIFIVVNDDAAGSWNSILSEDLHRLGTKVDLAGKYQESYYAVITPQAVIEDISDSKRVGYSGEIEGIPYSVSSYGYGSGVGYCSIVINGAEYSQNKRGLNIVVFEDGKVIDSVCFDTCGAETKVYR